MDRLLIPACLALLAAGTACSIKEDRGPCPCYLQVSFTDPVLDIRKSADIVRNCQFLVEGNSCGFDLLDFSPVEGKFRCTPFPREGESIVTFRVPRQGDNSLAVTIRPEGSPAHRFPLGEYIDRLGYNWKTEELQDIYVAIDLVRGLIDVRVADWEEGTTFPLVEQ